MFNAKTAPLLLLITIAAFSTPAYPATPAGEYDVKAALVINFARFTQWPAQVFKDSNQAIQLCVYGESNVIDAFAALQGKQIGARHLIVVNNQRLDKASSCHMIFLSGGNRHRLRRLLTVIDNKPVLLIGEMPDFTSSGGAVGLLKANNKIKILINLQVTRKAGLKISSRLLKLATVVDGE